MLSYLGNNTGCSFLPLCYPPNPFSSSSLPPPIPPPLRPPLFHPLFSIASLSHPLFTLPSVISYIRYSTTIFISSSQPVALHDGTRLEGLVSACSFSLPNHMCHSHDRLLWQLLAAVVTVCIGGSMFRGWLHSLQSW